MAVASLQLRCSRTAVRVTTPLDVMLYKRAQNKVLKWNGLVLNSYDYASIVAWYLWKWRTRLHSIDLINRVIQSNDCVPRYQLEFLNALEPSSVSEYSKYICEEKLNVGYWKGSNPILQYCIKWVKYAKIIFD